MSEPASTFHDELARVNMCIKRHGEEYHAFMHAAQEFQWTKAGNHQDNASSYMDAAMDAYMRACRLQEAEVRKRA